jgi:hypothetical protein
VPLKPNDSNWPGICAEVLGTITDIDTVLASTSAAKNRRIYASLSAGPTQPRAVV